MERRNRFQYKGTLVIIAAFLLIAAILYAERSGIRYQEQQRKEIWLSKEEWITSSEVKKSLQKNPTCLVLKNSKSVESMNAEKQFRQILDDMKVRYQIIDVVMEAIPEFEGYETAVILLSDLSVIKEHVQKISDWVRGGGNALFALTLQKDIYSGLIEQQLGILASGYQMARVENIYPAEDFMLGGGKSYEISDPFESAWSVELDKDVVVHAWNDGEKECRLCGKNDMAKGNL